MFVLRIIRPGRLDLSLGWLARWLGDSAVLGNSADEELSADLAGSGSVVATFELVGQKSNFLR